MSVRTRPALVGLCLWLGVVSGTAGDAPGADPAPPAEQSGFFARIAGWFRGDGANAHPSPPAEEPGGAGEAEAVTLGDVHRAVAELVAEVELLRRAKGVPDAPRRTAALGEAFTPAHVCAMALEVAEKTARVQRRLGMIPAETPYPGVAGLAPEALERAVRDILGELRRIKRQLVVDEAVEVAAPADASTPAALYRDLERASRLLDGLVGRPPTRGDVRARLAHVREAIRPLAARLGTAPGAAEPSAASTARTPREVAQALLRATYKAIGLQIALGMDASGAPAAAPEGAGEAGALEAAGRLLAELLRIQDHLGVGATPAEPASWDAPPAGAFGQAMRIVAHLDAMMRAAPGHGG